MKNLFILPFFTFICSLTIAQRIGKPEFKMLIHKEDSLKTFAVQIIQGINAENRFKADSIFTRLLVRSLKIKNSFHYPFDSLKTISVQYAPDSAFRIFTWQLVINENVIRQHGAIQMKTYDGSLKLYPLIDKSDVTTNLTDTMGNNYGWIGAIYYKIIVKKSGNQKYYTLLGFDENNIRSSRKIIEVLNFVNDEPVFGGRYFSYENDVPFKSAQSRYVMEFKKEAGPRLNYDQDLDMIIVEHLVSESNEPNKKWTLVGDGDYEGFKWQSGKWVHVVKVFNVVTPDGQAPVPNPIRDQSGNIDENKLKNVEEDVKQVPVKPKGKGEN
jgi:hypothetical protein